MYIFYDLRQKNSNIRSAYKPLFTFFWKMLLVVALTILAMFFGLSKSSAQGQIDPSFNGSDNGVRFTEGANRDVKAVVLQGDGKILIGGDFTSFNGAPINKIARLTVAGLADAGFTTGTGADSTVNDIIVQPDGKIVIAGAFNTYNGVSAPFITRLNANGTKDASFNAGTGPNGIVTTLALQADGKIIAGGYFTSFNGAVANHIVRLSATGARDATFTGNIANSVADLAIQSNGSVVVGINDDGNGLLTNFIRRLTATGATDASFNAGGAGANGSVKAVRIQADGKIFFGGEFSFYNTINSNYTRINVNGTPDATFTNGVAFAGPVNTIALQADGKVVIGWGYYSSIANYEGLKIVRLNGNGTSDASLNFELDSDLDHNVFAILLQPDGKLLVAETYLKTWPNQDRSGRYFGGRKYLANKDFKINRYSGTGKRDQTFCMMPSQTGANRMINSLVVQPDGKSIIGGYFYNYNGSSTNYLARLNSNGSKDLTFNAGGTGPNSYVYTTLLQTDGKILVGGLFTAYNGVSANFLIRLNTDGTRDNSFNYTASSTGGVKSLTIQPDGKIMVGGFGNLTRINSDGSVDNSFNVNIKAGYGYFFPYIESTVVQPDGKIIVGGYFQGVVGAENIPNLMRLNSDGTVDNTFDRSFYFDYMVYSICLQPDGRILLGGQFSNGNYLTRLNSNGTFDPGFNPSGIGVNSPSNSGEYVRQIVLQPDNKIMVGGNFTSYNGVSVHGLMKLQPDGSLDASFNPGGAGVNYAVNALALLSGGSKIFLAGDINTYNNTGKNNLLRVFGGDGSGAVVPTTYATVCASTLPYSWNGNAYSAAGTYTAVITNGDGSTRVDTLVLTVGAGLITGPDRACSFIANNTTAMYEIRVPAGSTITWSVSNTTTMQVFSGQGTTAAGIKFLGGFTSGNVYANVVNTSCGINITRSYQVTSAVPATPKPIISSSTSICANVGTSNVISYSTRKIPSATSYNWSAQAGTTTISHPHGLGANDTLVLVTFASGFTTSAISVQAVNSCGSSAARSLTIKRSNPATPSVISGPANVCLSDDAYDDVIYLVGEIAGVTYNWTVPAGASILSYSTISRNEVVIRFDAAYVSGSISVKAENGCGMSATRSLAVKKLKAGTPGAISATATVMCPNRQYTYSVNAMPSNASAVVWSVPPGGEILAGQGSTSITVSYSNNAISGYVTAQGQNACSSSSLRKLTVNLSICSSPLARGGEINTADHAQRDANNITTELNVYPNPSAGEFKLTLEKVGKENLSGRIVDMHGRIIKSLNLNRVAGIQFGADLLPGIYFLQIIEGTYKKQIKLIKIP